MKEFKHSHKLWQNRLQVLALKERYMPADKQNKWYGPECKARHMPLISKGKTAMRKREELRHKLEKIKQRLDSIETRLKQNLDQRKPA